MIICSSSPLAIGSRSLWKDRWLLQISQFVAQLLPLSCHWNRPRQPFNFRVKFPFLASCPPVAGSQVSLWSEMSQVHAKCRRQEQGEWEGDSPSPRTLCAAEVKGGRPRTISHLRQHRPLFFPQTFSPPSTYPRLSIGPSLAFICSRCRRHLHEGARLKGRRFCLKGTLKCGTERRCPGLKVPREGPRLMSPAGRW